MKIRPITTTIGLAASCLLCLPAASPAADIVHDSEYYILEAQNGERWAAEDTALDKKLAELRAKHGTPSKKMAWRPFGVPSLGT